MRFAILSHVLPPSPSGQAVVLYHIFSGFDPCEYYLISKENYARDKVGMESKLRLQAQYYSLPHEPQLSRPNRFGLGRLRSIINLIVRLVVRTNSIINIMHSEPTRAIIACSGDLVDIPAGFIASRMAHIPFFAYIFDDYVFQWTGDYRLFVKLVAPYIFKHSAGIIGPNEFICEEYRRRYDVSSTLVRNPCGKNELEKEPYLQWPAEPGKIKIVYTGAVYHANFDCFRNLIQAMESLSENNLELHIFTAQTQEQLETQGIQSKQVFIHSHVPYCDILEQQRKADILFLPLAFESPIPEVIRTSAPGKMGEYLASGRPVLAHVPADSFVSWYFKEHECGVVVETNEPAMLLQAIRYIMEDVDLRHRVGENARTCARTDFSLAVARAEFVKLFQLTARE